METSIQISPIEPADLKLLHELNQSEDPHLGSLSFEEFRILIQRKARHGWVARGEGGAPGMVGFIVAMDQDSQYESVNFKWFKARYPRFLYVDRIAVVSSARGLGIGRSLYERVFQEARNLSCGLVTCEVNLHPPNPESIRFHEALGFVRLGEQDTGSDPSGKPKRVCLMGLSSAASTPRANRV